MREHKPQLPARTTPSCNTVLCTALALSRESLALSEGQYPATVGHKFKSRAEGTSVFFSTHSLTSCLLYRELPLRNNFILPLSNYACSLESQALLCI